MSQVILTENEVRAVTSSRLAEKLGTDKDKVLSYSGKTIYVVATGKNFEQNCAPTLAKLRESNEVHIVDEAPKPKRRSRRTASVVDETPTLRVFTPPVEENGDEPTVESTE